MRSELGVVFLPLLVACSSADEPAHGLPATTPPPASAAPGTGGAMSSGGSSVFSPPPVLTLTPPTNQIAPPGPPDLGALCDPTRMVDKTGASLIIRDVATLQRFSLQRVLAQIQTTAGDTTSTTPLEFLQRLFDTENTVADGVFADGVHCDGDGFDPAFSSGHKPAYCPRAEGKLARSAGLFDETSPDFFTPVALVSRPDLMPSTNATCGEYRIVYAKQSGRTDPKDRVMLIFEGALRNPDGTLKGCRPVAEFLAGVESLAPGDDLANAMDAFYFQGLPGFKPVVHSEHYGAGLGGCSYGGTCGQIRLGQGMQAPFEFRQFQVMGREQESIRFIPSQLTSTPRPELFDMPENSGDPSTILSEIAGETDGLINADITRLHDGRLQSFDAGEIAVEGPAAPNFAARIAANAGGDAFKTDVARTLPPGELLVCPPDDPLTSDSIVARVTALTCAGCHAPEQVLPNGLHTGCGQTWPKTLAPVHIDENGNLSPALVDVFLPRRADFLQTYLRACDADAIVASLQPVPFGELLPL